MMTKIIRIPMPNPALIHMGDNTHHHDQLIVPTNFKTIKTIVNRPVNPIPPEAVELSLIIILP
jgi:hypothetical protein